MARGEYKEVLSQRTVLQLIAESGFERARYILIDALNNDVKTVDLKLAKLKRKGLIK